MKDNSQKITVCEKTGRVSVMTVNTDPSMTQQQYKDECDINHIMSRYMQTGELPRTKLGVYGDFSDMPDYQTALNTVLQAQDAFASLPAQIRQRFGNDPGALLEFLHDPSNKGEAIELGLVNPTPTTAVNVNNDKNDETKPAK